VCGDFLRSYRISHPWNLCVNGKSILFSYSVSINFEKVIYLAALSRVIFISLSFKVVSWRSAPVTSVSTFHVFARACITQGVKGAS
jgi:hypothetical protein